MPRPTLPAAELRRFTGSPRALLALLALVVVPLVYGGLYTWANEAPLTRLDNITAAVVNLDEPVTLKTADGTDQIVPLGRTVVGRLTASSSSSNYHWVLTDAAGAAAGLRDGRYAAVLTIPADFSRCATSTSGPPSDARAGRLEFQTNDAVNYLDGTIARAIATTTSGEAARTVTEGYLRGMYAGYGTLHDQLGTAAEGAGQLAAGADELAGGAGQAAGGVGELATGIDQLATGAGQLATGADALASGASQAAAGAAQLADGLTLIDSQTAALPQQTQALADGAAQVAAGATQLATAGAPLQAGAQTFAAGATQLATGATGLDAGAQQFAEGAGLFAAGADQFAAGVQPLVQGADATAAGASELATGLTAYTLGVDGLAAACGSSGAAPAFCAQLSQLAGQGAALRTGADGVATGTAQVADGLTQLETGATALGASAVQLGTGATEFGAGATQWSAGAVALGAGATDLAAGITQVTDGVAQLAPGTAGIADGTAQLAAGMPALTDGLHQAAVGSQTFAASLPALSSGASQLAGGVDQLAVGANQAASGAGELSTGLTTLADGTAQLGTGAADLSKGLAAGVEQIPTYSEAEQAQLAAVAATPVVSETDRVNAVANNGAGYAPYYMALALWVGALALYLVLRPLSPRALASSAPSALVALAGFLPAAALGAGQGVLLALLLQYGVGIGAASTWSLIGVSVLVALAFVAINQALVALFGAPGRFVALLLAGLQLAAAGGIYRIETAPEFIQWLNGWLPMTYAVDALRKVVAGGTTGLGVDIAFLVVAFIGALLVSVYAARRQRTWTLRRLHPAVAA